MFIGNTAYPCMLRFLIWSMFKLAPKNSAIREPLNFLLDHPRRCYTLLFPSGPTWMLLLILAFLNGVDIILFMIMDLKNPEVTSIASGWHRFCAGIFQAVSSRTTGTSTFNLSKIHVAVQFSLMGRDAPDPQPTPLLDKWSDTILIVMMYISVFPVAMSIRR
jgi:Trk-type K+ transport system membrane component